MAHYQWGFICLRTFRRQNMFFQSIALVNTWYYKIQKPFNQNDENIIARCFWWYPTSYTLQNSNNIASFFYISLYLVSYLKYDSVELL